MSAAAAQRAKEKGNGAFKAAKYPEAVGHYTEAILADASDPTFPLNRAAAYLKLGKNVDAERDCSTVLRLSPRHVKALYRRAQARIELGKLEEAKSDLIDALKIEPGNTAVEAEMDRVDKLLTVPKKKKKKFALLDLGTPDKHAPPRRRRVPIEIVESEQASSSTVAQPMDALTPVSSRSITRKPEDALPTPSPSPAGELPSKSDPKSEKPHASPKPLTAVGGGVFRSSGEHTVFRAPKLSHPLPGSALLSSAPATSSEYSDAPRQSPMPLFDFLRRWELASPSDRWDLLCTIPPQALPSLFKTSLEASLFVQILEICTLAVETTGDSAIKARVLEYLRWFQRVPRFSTVVLFLSRQEKELGRRLADAVGFSEWKV